MSDLLTLLLLPVHGNWSVQCVEINFQFFLTNVTAIIFIGDSAAPEGENLSETNNSDLYVVTPSVTELLQEILRQQTRANDQSRDLLLQGLANVTNVSQDIRASTESLGRNLNNFFETMTQNLDNFRSNLPSQQSTITNIGSLPTISNSNESVGTNVNELSQNLSQLSQLISTRPELPPKFRNSHLVNPIRFLQDLEKYFKRAGIHEGRYLEIALDSLEGPAENWATIYKSVWKKYNDFRRSFLHTYWSEQEQSKLRHRILTDTWTNKHSMIDHFAYFVNLAELLTEPFSERELVVHLMRHFPVHIQSLWSLAGQQTLAEAAEFLRQQEDIVTFRNHATSSQNVDRRARITSRVNPYQIDRTKQGNTHANNVRRVNLTNICDSTAEAGPVQGNAMRSN